jgi:hypothetical protein
MVELMKIPQTNTLDLNSENLSKMEKIIDEFFINTKEHIESKYKNKLHQFEIKQANLDDLVYEKREGRTIRYVLYEG